MYEPSTFHMLFLGGDLFRFYTEGLWTSFWDDFPMDNLTYHKFIKEEIFILDDLRLWAQRSSEDALLTDIEKSHLIKYQLNQFDKYHEPFDQFGYEARKASPLAAQFIFIFEKMYPLPVGTMLFRGSKQGEPNDYRFTKGFRITRHRPTSTSLYPHVATNFMQHSSSKKEYGDIGVLMIYKICDPDVRGAFMPAQGHLATDFQVEFEVLLQPHLIFEVTSTEKNAFVMHRTKTDVKNGKIYKCTIVRINVYT
jgi:hypothetical protein